MERRIGAAALLWGAGILLSRVIGVVREAVMGRTLAAGAEADVYFAAFTLPDWVNYLVAGGALTILLLPIYGQAQARGGDAEGWRTFSRIANFHLVFLGGVVLLAAWLAPALASVLAPGFSPEQLDRLVYLTRIILPAQIFHVLGGLLSGVLQARDRHLAPAMSGLVYTVVVILGGLVGSAVGAARFAADGFAWGTLVGAVCGPFLMNLLAARREGLRWTADLTWRHQDLRLYLLRAVPMMAAISIVMTDDWIIRRVGSTLATGELAILTYAKQLMKVPTGIFGVAMAIAAFPALSRLIADARRGDAYDLVERATRRVLVLAVGAQVAMSAAGPLISRILYGTRITDEQHLLVGQALAVFSLGLWAWAAQNVVSRGFYAGGNTWLPSLLGSVVCVLAFPLYGLAASRFGLLGVAAASTVAISVYTAVLLVFVRRYLEAAIRFPWRFAASLALGAVAGLATSFGVVRLAGDRFDLLWSLVVPSMLGLAAYSAVLALLRVEELGALVRGVLEKVQRAGHRDTGDAGSPPAPPGKRPDDR